MAVTMGFRGQFEVSFNGGKDYELVSKITEGTYTVESSEVDISSWDDDGNQNTIPGLNSRSISITGWLDPDNSVHERIENAVEGKQTIYGKLYRDKRNDKYIEARCTIQSFEANQPLDEAIQFSIELAVNGRVARKTAV